MQYEKILGFMEAEKEYGIWDFCELLGLKESRTKDILKGLSDYIEIVGGNRDRRYKKKQLDDSRRSTVRTEFTNMAFSGNIKEIILEISFYGKLYGIWSIIDGMAALENKTNTKIWWLLF